MEKLAKSSYDGLEVKMLLKNIEKTRNRVFKVLESLRNVEEKEIGDVLEELKLASLISDQSRVRGSQLKSGEIVR